MSEIMIELEQVNKYFKRQNGQIVHGLRDISLQINRGEFVSIIGSNGAGKSTFINCLTGQCPVSSGRITINRQLVSELSPAHLAKKIGRVFQDPTMGTAPRMTVFENLMIAKKRGMKRRFDFSLTSENRAALAVLLKELKLDLENRLEVPIENLSGGQRQVISLLMATLQKPELLVLDEHTAALDPRTAKQVMAMTMDLVKTHQLTTLMITHRLSDALRYSDRVLIMHQGQIKTQLYKTELQSLTVGELSMLLEGLTDEPISSLMDNERQ